jgi:hypothetical protein
MPIISNSCRCDLGSCISSLPQIRFSNVNTSGKQSELLIPRDPEVIPSQIRDHPERSRQGSRSKFGIIPIEFGIKSGSRLLSPLDFGIAKKYFQFNR